MTIIREVTKQCPHCAAHFQILALVSCNTFGTEQYTDGYLDGWVYDDASLLICCPACKGYVWQQDLVDVGESNDANSNDANSLEEYSDSVDSLPFASRLSLEEYEATLPQQLWRNDEEEKYIRLRAWWAANGGSRRYFDWKPPAFTQAQQANLESLLAMLDSKDPDELLMRAEIYRELGQFEACLKALNKLGKRAASGGLAPAINAIRQRAESGDRQVAPVGEQGHNITIF